MAPFALVRSLKRQHASQASGFAAVTIAAAVLIGWWGGLPMLSSWGSGFATVKPVTALCLTLLGVGGGMAVFALFTYLSGIHTLHGSAAVDSPPLPTAVGVLCIASGIIAQFGTVPAFRTPRPLWQLQVVLGCAVLAPLLLFGFRIGVGIADTQLDQVRKDLVNEAGMLSASVDRQIIGEIERLQALAASPSLRQGELAEFQRQAEASLAFLQIGNIVLIDRNMQELVNTSVPFGTHLRKAAISEPLVQRSLATGKPQVAGLFIGAVTRQLMFSIIVPVQIDGENRYVLGRSQDHHALAHLVAANELPAGWHAVVSDAVHRIIAQSQHEDALIGKE